MSNITLIIGGARSGKSALAEGYAKLSKFPVTYVATAQALDNEMQQRIAQHQADRPTHWQLIESPLLLAKTIEAAISKATPSAISPAISTALVSSSSSSTKTANNNHNSQGICILVDCLTLWLTNCLCTPIAYGENEPENEVNSESSTDKNQKFAVNLAYWQQEKQQLLALLASIHQQANVDIILVSNEVGHGIVPMGELTRQFVDQAGWLHQAIAELANDVEFVMAGLPLALKSSKSSASANVNSSININKAKL